MSTLQVRIDQAICTVELARPKVRNAFNDELIDELTQAFEKIALDESIRAVVLRGSGPTFCAGGDLAWMQKSASLTGKQNLAETRKLTKMFATMNACPKPLIGLVQGAAIGGGVGLVSVCDYVVCSHETVFSLSEVRLGIIPACIGPFVIAKVGETHARAYFISAERFSAERALQIGLVHEAVGTTEDLNRARDRISKNLLQCGPQAMTAAKKLIREVRSRTLEQSYEYVSQTLANLRVTPEAQEGFKAFFEKRKPSWSA